MNELNILYVVQPTIGGAAFHVNQLASGLDKGAFSVMVASPSEGHPRNTLTNREVRYEAVEFTRFISVSTDLRSLLDLFSIMRKHRFDIVHAHSSKAGILARIAARVCGVPIVVYTPHGFAFYQAQGWRRAFYYSLEQLASHLTDRIVCVSNSEGESAAKDGIAPAKKLVVIRNGVNPDVFNEPQTGKLRNLLSFHDNHLIIGMVARLANPKKPEDLIRAADIILRDKGLPQAFFVFIGDGELVPEGKRLVKGLGIGDHVFFVGERDDSLELVADFDIAVLASSSEALPYTVMEAMAGRKPVVGSRVTGIIDLVRDGETGFTYENGDYQQLAARLGKLMLDRDLRLRLGQRARGIIESEFTAKRMIEETESLYRRLSKAKLGK